MTTTARRCSGVTGSRSIRAAMAVSEYREDAIFAMLTTLISPVGAGQTEGRAFRTSRTASDQFSPDFVRVPVICAVSPSARCPKAARSSAVAARGRRAVRSQASTSLQRPQRDRRPVLGDEHEVVAVAHHVAPDGELHAAEGVAAVGGAGELLGPGVEVGEAVVAEEDLRGRVGGVGVGPHRGHAGQPGEGLVRPAPAGGEPVRALGGEAHRHRGCPASSAASSRAGVPAVRRVASVGV